MRLLFSLLLLLPFSVLASSQTTKKVAIVIDDIGYRHTDRAALMLPRQVAFAVLPHTPHGKELAQQAKQQQREIMLHVPMESIRGLNPGPGALTSAMSEQNLYATLQAQIDDIPYVIGINNHMGSRLTQLSQPMNWTMKFLKANDLFFLDSRTSKFSQAEYVAQQHGVPSLHRKLFLDNKLDESYIENQFNKLIRLSKRDGVAVAIAHPHPQTLQVLHRMLPTLAQHQVELVDISSLLQPGQEQLAQGDSTDRIAKTAKEKATE
ncbi:divergent polysaccharide deacetylase family protein [Thalassotalea mangrovi]|uniref:divergent polysaccharide deacetylase family protein n=1 Tax=Thalassotalea mangrovi TaxID=2572245 RepID=UPI001FE43D83|nr:divergent polysaccharide deacetylase family protein [Thalassotalea mangrovi]